ncbi:MAG: 8-oxoguanine DNA glycosylase, N-terminal domain-containing protein, partial [Methanomassiliicoccaceae archaeon]|nr:8-oxoguanine DNA glycosylase, N-terminal domain-containing protein [Methanomassiliicoccaceae archaeon]
MMILDINISLNASLGCGQAHRWIRRGNKWEGVLYGKIITLGKKNERVVCEGTDDKGMMLRYLRHEDDLDIIYS